MSLNAGSGREELVRRSTQESMLGRDVPDLRRRDSRDHVRESGREPGRGDSHRGRDRRERGDRGDREMESRDGSGHHRIESGRGDDWSQKSGAPRGREDRLSRKRKSEDGTPPDGRDSRDGREEKRMKR